MRRLKQHEIEDAAMRMAVAFQEGLLEKKLDIVKDWELFRHTCGDGNDVTFLVPDSSWRRIEVSDEVTGVVVEMDGRFSPYLYHFFKNIILEQLDMDKTPEHDEVMNDYPKEED